MQSSGVTRVSDLIRPEPIERKNSQSNLFWSYHFRDFLKLLMIRNRGYLSRKGFNILFDVIEICFLAYYCHPSFYSSLLFIPFMSFFMNLLIEEVFSLNRAEIFSGKQIPSKVNMIIIGNALILFIIPCSYYASAIVLKNSILITIFSSRILLIIFQAYSFSKSIEIISFKRVFFSPMNWWIALGVIVCGLSLLMIWGAIDFIVPAGIALIYSSRFFIEFRFLRNLKAHFNKKKSSDYTSNLNPFFLRAFIFIINLVTFYSFSKLITNSTSTTLNIFIFVFGFRLLNRPFRSLQVDYFKYLKRGPFDWIFLRQIQSMIISGIMLIGMIAGMAIFNEFSINEIISLSLLGINTIYILSLSNLGQEPKISSFFIPIRLLTILLTWIFPHPIVTFILLEGSLSIMLLLLFVRGKDEFCHLTEITNFNNNRFASLQNLNEFKKQDRFYFLCEFNSYAKNHLKKLFNGPLNETALLLSTHQWLIPQTDDLDEFALWKVFPNELRKIEKISHHKISTRFPIEDIPFLPLTGGIEIIKVAGQWFQDNERINEPKLLELIAQIEWEAKKFRSFTECKFQYHLDGKFLFPLNNLGKVRKIILLDHSDKRLIDSHRNHLWRSLISYLSSH